MVDCKILDRHLLERINEKHTKFEVNSMTENLIGKFLNTDQDHTAWNRLAG